MYGIILYDLAAGAVVAFVLFISLRASRAVKGRVAFLTELEEYCLELRHRFGEKGVLADAVFDSFSPSYKRIADFAFRMMRVFGNDRQQSPAARDFLGSLSDPYEKLLVSVCSLVEEYGDRGGGSFGETLLKMVIDIREERRHLMRRLHGFRGLAATAVIPCLFVRFLGNWGMETIPSLIPFYHGRGGVYLRCVIPVLALTCGLGVMVLSDPEGFRERFGRVLKAVGSIRVPEKVMKHFSVFISKKLRETDTAADVGRFCFLSVICSLILFFFTFGSIVLGHTDMRKDLIFDTSDLENTLRIADSAQINAARKVIPDLMEEAVNCGFTINDGELTNRIMGAGIRGEREAGLVAEEFRRRLSEYEDEQTDVIDLMYISAIGLLGWMLPTVWLVILATVMGSRIREEVMQFESVIDVEKDVNGMTVPVMLESLLYFASVTRTALIGTIMDYNSMGSRAFLPLCGPDSDRSLKRLAGFFMQTDTLGIRGAFDEVSDELCGMRDERKLDRAMRLEDEVMLAGIFGVLPGGLVVFGYLLVPFISRSLELFNTYSDSLGMM